MKTQCFTGNGFVLVSEALEAGECEAVANRVGLADAPSGGTRGLLSQDGCVALAKKLRTHPTIALLVLPDFIAVQCTYFEKSASRNWLVPIHQDLSIPVAEHVDSSDLHGWSEKEDVLFVQAPIATLEQLIIVRLHLDPCRLTDGPLRVVPGSHVRGRITPEAALIEKRSSGEVTCVADPGDVLAMSPLLLHTAFGGLHRY